MAHAQTAAFSPSDDAGPTGAPALRQGADLLGAVEEAAGAVARQSKEVKLRVASANTQKARQEMMRAIAAKNLNELKAALDRGTDPNFLLERQTQLQSPMRFAASEGWAEGVAMLAENGASQSGAYAQFKEEQPEFYAANAVALRDKNPWDRLDEPRLFALWMQNETDQELRKRCASTASRNPQNALWLMERGEDALLERPFWQQLERNAIDALRAVAGKDQAGSIHAALTRALWKRMPDLLAKEANERWERLVRADAVELIGELARSGSAAPAGWSGTLLFIDFPARSRGFAPAGVAKKNARNVNYFEATGAFIRAPLWLIALVAGSTRAAQAFGQVPELQQAGLAFARTAEILASTQNPQALREAARQGVSLALCADANGNTPLHVACAMDHPTKNSVIELVKVFPDWASMKNKAGDDPAALLTKNKGLWQREKREKLVSEMQSLSMRRDLTQIRKSQRAADKANPRPKGAAAAPVALKKTTRRL